MTLVWHNTLFSIGSVVGAGELSGNVEYQGFGCECLSAVLCCFFVAEMVVLLKIISWFGCVKFTNPCFRASCDIFS